MRTEDKAFFQDISIKEINLALDKILKQKVVLSRGDGSQYIVPVYMRGRDSKLIPDMTQFGMIEVSYTGMDNADPVYEYQCDIAEVVAQDAEGNPTKYVVHKAPQAVEMTYHVTARAQTWDAIADIHFQLDKIFPPRHRSLEVRDRVVNLFRRGYSAGDNEEFGIFIRTWTLGIIGYIFVEDCNDKSQGEVFAVRDIAASIQLGTDPEMAVPDELITEEIEV